MKNVTPDSLTDRHIAAILRANPKADITNLGFGTWETGIESKVVTPRQSFVFVTEVRDGHIIHEKCDIGPN